MSQRSCSVDGCQNVRKRAGGLCSTHYRQAVRDGHIARLTTACTVGGCTNVIPEELPESGGLCTKHHKRMLRRGTTDDPDPYPETCELFYCEAPYFALGLCERHYKNQWQRDQTILRWIARSLEPPEMCRCSRCGDKFPRAHFQGPRAQYCPNCKPQVSAEQKVRWWEKNRPELVTEYTCKYCGCQFCYIVPDGKPRTICAGCYGRAAVESSKLYADRYPEQYRRRKAVYHGIRRARKRGADAEPVDKYVVFERDGWVCVVCCKPIDPELRYPHPRSASLDHVIPLAVYPPQHNYANAAAAHLACNRRKGSKPLSEVVL